MSTYEFKLPDIGEGVVEGEIVKWLVQEGDVIAEDQPLIEVMTDKATVTIGAPKTGTVSELRAKVGDVVPVGAIIVTLETNGAGKGTTNLKLSETSVADAPADPSGLMRYTVVDGVRWNAETSGISV